MGDPSRRFGSPGAAGESGFVQCRAGIERSVGSVGDSYRSALAETIDDLYRPR